MSSEETLTRKILDQAGSVLKLIRLGQNISLTLESQLTADADDGRRLRQERYTEVIRRLQEGYRNSLARELGKLQIPLAPSQSEWDAPDFRIYTDFANGGIETTSIRLGSVAFHAHGHRVRIPLQLDTLFDSNPILFWKESNRAQAVAHFQAILLRHLATVTPGRLLLRCFDAKEHGRAFASFIQRLPAEISGDRAGVDIQDFNSFLAAMDQRIASVSQRLLNAKTPTLLDYNRLTKGELEPFILFAIDNFGDGMEKDHIQRVIQIAQNGRKAGVFTLLACSNLEQVRKAPTATAFLDGSLQITVNASDVQLQQEGVHLSRDVSMDVFPDDAVAEKIFAEIRAAHQKRANRTVAFDVTPTNQWANGDCLTGIDIPIGLMGDGAEMRLVFNEEGLTGALLVGAPGKGKSNLLHVMITRLMLSYSPNHLNLYLLDLKGVEFNIYEKHRNPHIRMILSDMDQKLGLSMLRDFEGELARRKRLLSAQGKQKLSDYNKSKNGESLPRIVVVIDEFQKLFTNDVALSREAEGIINNLLRQGRSYGIHLIMASQNLSAQTTPRDIKTMFPIKIVLQFNSPSEYSIVLEEDYDLKSILKDRGQAVYHVGVGTPTFFLIPFLPAVDLGPVLVDLGEALRIKGHSLPSLVFLNGEEASDIKRNDRLRVAIQSSGSGSNDIPLWLGDAFSLTGSAGVILRRQAAANMLIGCQERDFEYAMNIVCAIVLAVMCRDFSDKCYIFIPKTGSSDSNDTLRRLANAFPEKVNFIEEDNLTLLNTLATSIRDGTSAASSYSTFLIVPGMQRFGALRGDMKTIFNRPIPARGAVQAQSSADNWRLILEDGPRVGIHTLIVSDSPSGLERPTIALFSLRIAFRLMETDSLALFGTKDALGLKEGLAVLIDRGESEEPHEFRPYTYIDALWLDDQLTIIKNRQRALV
jgi:DNA segregation ATPase FtsK/SpoIIIE, S-DNA-T family